MNQIGKKIQRIRTSMHLTQGEFGEKINVSSATICNWEKGLRTPSMKNILKLCKTYKVEPAYIIKGAQKIELSEDSKTEEYKELIKEVLNKEELITFAKEIINEYV